MSAEFGHRRARGQALVEFALVLPVFLTLVAAVIQFGILFWAQNTLTQVVRDTGRWAATQQATPCSDGAGALGSRAAAIGAGSSLIGYASGEFGSATVLASDASVNGFMTPNAMAVAWIHDSSEAPAQGCPPSTNQAVWHVAIKMNHVVPTFFPGVAYLPGLGTCDADGCRVTLSSSAQFRMEPAP